MKNKRKILVSLLLILAMLLSVVPVFAQEASAQGTKISPWTYENLIDSQMMGILDLEKSSKISDYTEKVTVKDIENLNKNLENKMKSTELKENLNFKSVEFEMDNTRESILLSIYNIIGKFDKEITSDENPLEYLMDKKILLGNGKDYKLKDVATLEEAITFYVRAIDYLYRINNLGGKGVFYKVENKGNTVYLFGSIHMADYFMYPIDNKRIEAFNNSDELLVELNIQDPEILASFQTAQLRKDGKKLKDELGEELYSRYKAIFDQMGVEEATYEDLEGWAAANQLTILPTLAKYPYATILGVDNYFITKAKLKGIPVKSLESVDIQIDTLKSFYAGDEDILKEVIKANLEVLNSQELIEKSIKEMETLLNNWNFGNEKEIGEIFEKDESSKILTEKRDPALAEKIKGLLNSGEGKTYFVLVGAGHYAPKGSIVDILENEGFKVENLNK